MPNKENWPPENGDLTHLIERLDAFEERENVRFEALSARIVLNLNWLKVCGEIHARDGLIIARALKVVVTVYDAQGKILDIGHAFFKPETFYGFEAFDVTFYSISIVEPIAKIRLYPQPSK